MWRRCEPSVVCVFVGKKKKKVPESAAFGCSISPFSRRVAARQIRLLADAGIVVDDLFYHYEPCYAVAANAEILIAC